MSRYRFAVEYLGTNYSGWQIQPGRSSVQGALEKAFAVCLRRPCDVVGSGRTDTGVHARGQVAHFDFPGEIDVRKTQGSVNALLPDDIRIRSLEGCPGDFHCRYDALARYYRYVIAVRNSPLMAGVSWHCPFHLDPEVFQEELLSAMGHHDFANFSVNRKDGKPTDCTLSQVRLERRSPYLIVHLQGDRFLHKMVRALVGAAGDVARGRFQKGLIRSALSGRAPESWTWAESRGLCLESVIYEDFKPEP